MMWQKEEWVSVREQGGWAKWTVTMVSMLVLTALTMATTLVLIAPELFWPR